MRWGRAFDVALGLSAITWAGLGLLRATDRPLAVRLGLAALNLLVGGLFLARRSPVARGGIHAALWATPSIALGAATVGMTRAHWPLSAQIVFVLGAIFACVSLATLGRSFALLPSRRRLVVRGPYRLVRHPAYLSELIMLVGCSIAAPRLGVPLTLAVGLTLGWRIGAEERLLSESPGWRRYTERVPWRLLPKVY